MPMAIIDLVSILPTILSISAGFRLLKIFRLIRSFRVFRALKAFRYSKSISMIIHVMKKQYVPLLSVCGLASAYVVLSALLVYNVEPDTFDTFLMLYIGRW